MDEADNFPPRPPQPMSWEDVDAITGGLADVPVELIHQGRVDWKYQFAPTHFCGRRGCVTKHGHGYLVALRDGRHVNIGHVCAKKHANTDAWDRALRTYSDLRKAESLAAAFQNMRDEAERKQVWLDSVRPRITRSMALIRSFLHAAKGPLLAEITRRAERNDSKVVQEFKLSEQEVEARRAMILGGRVDKVASDVYVPAIETRHVGDIAGLAAFRPLKDPESHARRLQELITTLVSWSSYQSLDRDDLRAMQRAMREFGPFTADLEEVIRNAEAFFSEQNIRTLMLLPVIRRQGIVEIVIDGQDVRLTRKAHWGKAA